MLFKINFSFTAYITAYIPAINVMRIDPSKKYISPPRQKLTPHMIDTGSCKLPHANDTGSIRVPCAKNTTKSTGRQIRKAFNIQLL